MSKTYAEKLLDSRWDEKRNRILKRDECTCNGCGAINKKLHVHHLIYISDREPWQYRDGDMIALCVDCHEYEHEINGSLSQVERGARAVSFPHQPRSLSEVLASATG
jgi:5-methylcytosine-specific restriction endonuclease McrA